MKAGLSALLSAIAVALAIPSAGQAAFVVNTTADPGGAGCSGGVCSLRQAIEAGDALLGLDEIELPAGHYTLALGQLDAASPFAIEGKGARSTTIDGAGITRILNIGSGATPSSLTGVTLTGGRAVSAGAISSAADVALSEVTVADNSSSSSLAGAIHANGADLTIERSTLSDNKAWNSGGAIYAQGSTVSITNSTLSGNQANVSGGSGFGGAITGTSSTLTISSTTIAGNSAEDGGGIRLDISTTGTFKNSIVADNTAENGITHNCSITAMFGDVVSEGGNLDNDDNCGFDQASDKNNTPPGIAALADNGGPTDTRALAPTSAAVDATSGCPATDQRGVARDQRCDIGAFEYRPPQPAVPGGDATAAVVSGLSLKPTAFAPLNKGGSIAARKRKRAPRGTTVSYKLSEAASVAFTVERKLKGRKRGKKCSTTRKRGKRCTTYKAVKGSFTQAGKAGTNSLKFSGRVNNRKLRRGSYRLTAISTDAAGNRGVAVRKAFRIVR